MNTIIGIAGTNGSGKDTVGLMLAEKYGYLFVSGSDMLREEAKRQGLPVEREVLRTISSDWRRKFGLGVLIDKAYEQYKNDGHKGLAVVSLRNPGEVDRVHELGGIVMWVDADPKVRYERIYSRQRTTEDNKTFQEFLAEQEAEMQPSGDAATLNMAGVKEKADIFIENNGPSIEEFKKEAEQALLKV